MNRSWKTKAGFAFLVSTSLLFAGYAAYGAVAAADPTHDDYQEFQESCEDRDRLGETFVYKNESGEYVTHEITEDGLEECRNTSYEEYVEMNRASILSGAPFSPSIGGAMATVGVLAAGGFAYLYREGPPDE